MRPVDQPGQRAEVLRLRLEGFTVRRIARHLQMGRLTVRRVLDRHSPPPAPRHLFLEAEEQPGSVRLDNTLATLAPVEST